MDLQSTLPIGYSVEVDNEVSVLKQFDDPQPQSRSKVDAGALVPVFDMRFVFLGSELCLGLPSDLTSR